jgi:hypothetical protein
VTLVVVEERRDLSAPRQAALLEPEQEHGLEAARSCAQEVEDGDPARLVRRGAAHARPLERCEDVLARERLTDEALPAGELVEDANGGLVRPEVEPSLLAGRRGVETVAGAQHRR